MEVGEGTGTTPNVAMSGFQNEGFESGGMVEVQEFNIEAESKENEIEEGFVVETKKNNKEEKMADDLRTSAKEDGFEQALAKLAEGEFRGKQKTQDKKDPEMPDLQTKELSEEASLENKVPDEKEKQKKEAEKVEKEIKTSNPEKTEDVSFNNLLEKIKQQNKENYEELKNELMKLMLALLLEEMERNQKALKEKEPTTMEVLSKMVELFILSLIGSEEDIQKAKDRWAKNGRKIEDFNSSADEILNKLFKSSSSMEEPANEETVLYQANQRLDSTPRMSA